MNISNFTDAAVSRWSNFVQVANTSVARWSGVILATSAAALVGLGIYRWNQSSKTAPQDPAFDKIQKRVCQAYSYVFGGLTLTATAAAATYISGIAQYILRNSFVSFGIFATSIASLIATMVTDKEESKIKHIAWAIFNVSMGMMLSPVGFLSSALVAQAAVISLGLGGALTLAAFLAPNRRFLAWEGPLMAALTSITIASSIAYFFPGSAFAYGVDRVSLYGGLLIFSGLLMSSTQQLITKAANQDDKTFDPINSSLNIYLDGLNIFVRILRILEENKKDERKPPVV